MNKRPVRSDQRYTVALEFCGYPKARYVLRFCGEFVASFAGYSAAVVRAVGESNVRRGALVAHEQAVAEHAANYAMALTGYAAAQGGAS